MFGYFKRVCMTDRQSNTTHSHLKLSLLHVIINACMKIIWQ